MHVSSQSRWTSLAAWRLHYSIATLRRNLTANMLHLLQACGDRLPGVPCCCAAATAALLPKAQAQRSCSGWAGPRVCAAQARRLTGHGGGCGMAVADACLVLQLDAAAGKHAGSQLHITQCKMPELRRGQAVGVQQQEWHLREAS